MTDYLHFLPFFHTLEGFLCLAEQLLHVSGAEDREHLQGRRITIGGECPIKESIQLTRVEVFRDVFTDEKRVEILGWPRRFRQIRHFLTVVRHEYL